MLQQYFRTTIIEIPILDKRTFQIVTLSFFSILRENLVLGVIFACHATAFAFNILIFKTAVVYHILLLYSFHMQVFNLCIYKSNILIYFVHIFVVHVFF